MNLDQKCCQYWKTLTIPPQHFLFNIRKLAFTLHPLLHPLLQWARHRHSLLTVKPVSTLPPPLLPSHLPPPLPLFLRRLSPSNIQKVAAICDCWIIIAILVKKPRRSSPILPTSPVLPPSILSLAIPPPFPKVVTTADGQVIMAFFTKKFAFSNHFIAEFSLDGNSDKLRFILFVIQARFFPARNNFTCSVRPFTSAGWIWQCKLWTQPNRV